MPWKPSDAQRHTKAADTPELQRKWANEANTELSRSGDDALAIRKANAAVNIIKRRSAKKHAKK